MCQDVPMNSDTMMMMRFY